MEKKFENFDLSREELEAIRKDPKLIKVGMGGIYGIGSDAYAFEVIGIIDDKHLMCRELSAKQVGDYFGDQKWELYSDEENSEFKLFFYRGSWRKQVGRKLSKYGHYSIGYADAYQDPSF